MLLVSRWDDEDADDGALPAMVDALLAFVSPAAADRSLDVRPHVAEAAKALSAAGHGDTRWHGTPQPSAPVEPNTEEIMLPDDDDVDEDDNVDAQCSIESPAGLAEAASDGIRTADHAHITNGVAECCLHEAGAEGLQPGDQRPASCIAGTHAFPDGDASHQRTEPHAGPSVLKSKKARWLKAAERNRSRKKAKLTDGEQATAVPC